MLVKDFKPIYKKNEKFPLYETVQIDSRNGYILNHFMTGKFTVEDVEDGVYDIAEGTPFKGESAPNQKSTYLKFLNKYQEAKALTVKISTVDLHVALKRVKAFSTDEKVLLVIHGGKAKLACMDDISRCEVQIAEVDPDAFYFQFISAKVWQDAIKMISEQQSISATGQDGITADDLDTVQLFLYETDPLCRVAGSGFDIFLIGKYEDRKYF